MSPIIQIPIESETNFYTRDTVYSNVADGPPMGSFEIHNNPYTGFLDCNVGISGNYHVQPVLLTIDTSILPTNSLINSAKLFCMNGYSNGDSRGDLELRSFSYGAVFDPSEWLTPEMYDVLTIVATKGYILSNGSSVREFTSVDDEMKLSINKNGPTQYIMFTPYYALGTDPTTEYGGYYASSDADSSITPYLEIEYDLASGELKYYNNYDWNGRPVQYWNGTEWVVRPMKYWTGTEWLAS